MSILIKPPIKVEALRLRGKPFVHALFSFVLLWIVSLSDAHADQRFYRCVANGKTTYTDKPCDAPTLPATQGNNSQPNEKSQGHRDNPSKTIELDYTTPYGVWRGQAQYQTTEKGHVIQVAHSVVPLILEVEQLGRVRGASTENGCKMLGVASPYITPMILTLDVTLSGCRYPDYNRRYSGFLTLYKANNQVNLSLNSHDMGTMTPRPGTFDIKATMRR
ncbi:MAG: DUF4124 domain-containing protein [Thiobacillaceae bacterium]